MICVTALYGILHPPETLTPFMYAGLVSWVSYEISPIPKASQVESWPFSLGFFPWDVETFVAKRLVFLHPVTWHALLDQTQEVAFPGQAELPVNPQGGSNDPTGIHFLARLRNWCAHQEVVYIYSIHINLPEYAQTQHENMFILPLSHLQLDLQIISRSFHLSPKKEHQNAEFWKQLSVSLYIQIYTYIYIHLYFHPFTNDPTSHHRFTLDFAYSPQHNYLTGLRTGSCGTPRLVLH